jgi:hypothetical protein
MRRAIVDKARMAGDYLRTKDEQYGQLLVDLIVGKDGSRMSNNPLLGGAQGIAAMLAGAPATKLATDLVQHSPTDPRLLTMLGKAAEYGVPAAAAGIRYGLPAVGITETGKALMSLLRSETEGETTNTAS